MAQRPLLKINKPKTIPKPEDQLPPTIVAIFKFINPFHPSHDHLKTESKSLYSAREKILRLFKTVPLSKREITKRDEHQVPEQKKAKFFSFAQEMVAKNITYPLISQHIKKELPWLVSPLSKKDKTQVMSKFEFNRTMISVVLFTIRELGFGYKLLKSRNEEEFYVKVTATEHVLISYAKSMNYRLKFKKNHGWKRKFQSIPPYGPIWLYKDEEYLADNPFVHYDLNSQEAEKGSLFTFTDKYRIVSGVLSHKMDLHILKNYDLLVTSFVPHEYEPLMTLKNEWATLKKTFSPQEIDKVKTYFSEQLAFYFCWLETYKDFMIVASIIGTIVFLTEIFSYFTSHNLIALSFQIGFCLFLAIWAVSFEQYWIRKEKMLAWEWGTLEFGEQEIQREQFEGIYVKDEASGKMKVVKKGRVKHHSVRFFSFSTILLFVTLVIVVVVSIFRLRITLLKDNEWKQFGALIAALIMAIQIIVFDVIYSKVAQVLTNWENHETMNQYNNSLALKLFLFRFVNGYSGLLYIAFFKEYFEGKCGFEGCLSELGFSLTIIFVTNMVLNIIELGFPWFLSKFRAKWEMARLSRKASIRENLYPVETESQLEPYDYAIEDYMEMSLQFGYVALFGASFPLITLLALLEICLEIRVDALKLCKFVRRPEPIKAEDIGIWKKIILFISIFGVFTNSGIIIITSGLLDNYEWREKFTIFVVMEHVLMLFIVLIRYLIPDYPGVVFKGNAWAKRIVKDRIAGKNEDAKTDRNNENGLDKVGFFISEMDLKYQDN